MQRLFTQRGSRFARNQKQQRWGRRFIEFLESRQLLSTVFNASPSANPGDIFSLQGSGFSGSASVLLSSPNQTQISIPVIKAGNGQISARVPTTTPLNVYSVQISDGGLSQTVYINQATAMHFDTDIIAPSGSFRVFGRNLVLGSAAPTVRFVNPSTQASFNATVNLPGSDSEQLNVTAPSNLPTGVTYNVYVSNGLGGGNGETLAQQQMDATTAGVDNWNLNVPWAKDLNFYGNVYNVKTDSRLSIKAIGDGVANDTAAIANAISVASAAGGGVVYLPAGTYKCSSANQTPLDMKSNVVVVGDGMNSTTLTYGQNTPNGAYGAIFPSNISKAGIYGITFTNVNSTGSWQNTIASFGAGRSEIFIASSRLNMGGGNWLFFGGGDRLLFQNNEVNQQTTTTPFFNGVLTMGSSTDTIIRGNTFKATVGTMIDVTDSERFVIENNSLIRDVSYQPLTTVRHGMALTWSKNMAVLNNSFTTINGTINKNNDGESILSEGGGGNRRDEEFGSATSASSTTLVDSTKNFSGFFSGPRPVVTIISGTGAGQWRYVTASSGGTLTVDHAWDVTPTAGSHYSTFDWSAEQWIVKGNNFQNQGRGIWFYNGSARDTIVTQNILTNSDGMYLRPNQYTVSGGKDFNVIYNLQIEGNTLANTTGDRPSYIANLGVQPQVSVSYGTASIGVEIRNNSITAKSPNTFDQNATELGGEGYMNYFLQQAPPSFTDTGVPFLLGTILQGNTAVNTTNSYWLSSGSYNTVIDAPTNSNVTNVTKDDTIGSSGHGSVNTFIGSTLSGAPSAPSGLTATTATTSQINLAWTDNASNETGFQVDRATNSTFTTGLVTLNVGPGAVAVADGGLTANTTYYYRIRAYNAIGSSSNSSTASAVTTIGGIASTTTANNATATYGGTISVSASVTATGVTVNSGTVQFVIKLGATTIQTINSVAVSSGTATTNLTTSLYPAGSYSITATYTPDGSQGLNGSTSASPGTLTVNKANLTLTGDNKSFTYAGTVPGLTGTLSGFVNGDNSSVVTGTGSFSTTAVGGGGGGSGASIGVHFSANHNSGANTTPSGTNTYNVTGSAGVVAQSSWNNISMYNQVGNNTTIGTSTSYAKAVGAGSYGSQASNQTLTDSTGASTAATLTSFQLNNTYESFQPTASQTNQNGQLMNTYLDHYNGSGATQNAPNAVVIGNIPYGSYDVYVYFTSDATGRTGNVSVGSTTYYYSTLSQQNTFTQTTSTSSGTFTASNYAKFSGISGSTLTIGNNAPGGGSGITGVQIVSLSSSPSGAGTYPITAAVGTLAASNYNINTFNNGTMTVNKAPLTVTADNKSKTAGQANPALTATITGYVNSENSSAISGSPSISTTATTGSPAGTYPITPALGTLSAANYSFGFVNGTLTVTGGSQITPTINWSNPSAITYGTGLGSSQLNATATNGVGGATIAGSFAYSPNTGTILNAGANQTLSVTFTPTDTATYSTATGNVQITVNKANLTVSADAKSKTYGAANPTLTATITGFVNGDNSSVVSGAANLSTSATTGSSVGSYSITSAIGTLSASNYNFTTFNNGTLTVNKATLNVTADAKSKVYGTANPTLTSTLSGFVNGDTAAVVSGSASLSTSATTGSGVGNYTITAANGTLSATNYQFNPVNGNLAVTAAPLTVTANNASKTYGSANPSFSSNITGFVNGDTIAVVSGSASHSTSATTGSNVGTYAITPAVGTLSASNYSFSTFNNGTLTVNAAALTVSADAKSKTYGAANPTLTATLTGFVNGDTSAVVSGSAGLSTSATTGSAVGSYAITAAVGTLSASNYTFSTFNNSTLTVNKAALQVTADGKTKVYGAANPTLTSQFSGFVNGDTAAVVSGSASLSTSATTGSGVGSYTITTAIGTLAATNYSFTLNNGSLSVTPAPLTVTADNKSMTQGQSLPPLTATISGFVNGDTSAVVSGSASLSTTATGGGGGGSSGTISVKFAANHNSVANTTPTSTNTYNVTGTAGVSSVGNWNNISMYNAMGNNTTIGSVTSYAKAVGAGSYGSQASNQTLADSTGASTAATLTSFQLNDTYESFQPTASQTDQNGQLLNTYLDHYNGSGATANSSSAVVISNIPYASYNVLVYFTSDTTGRAGTVTLGSTTYYYMSMAQQNTFTAATSTTAGTYVAANYAAFNGLSGSTFTIGNNAVGGGSGIAGIQIVSTAAPPSIAIKFAANHNSGANTTPTSTNTYNVTGSAGVIAQTNWNNISMYNAMGNNTTLGSVTSYAKAVGSGSYGSQASNQTLTDSTGSSTAATLTSFQINNTYESFQPTASQTNQNGQLLNTYLDHYNGSGATANASSAAVVSNIPYSSYDVYVYFTSDGAGRTGSVSIGSTTYYYATLSQQNTFTQTTSTSSGTYTSSNYAKFSGVSGSTFTIGNNSSGGGSGLAGIQIVSLSGGGGGGSGPGTYPITPTVGTLSASNYAFTTFTNGTLTIVAPPPLQTPSTSTKVRLGGTAFDDANGNGVQDAGETGIAGATVNVISGGITVASRTTDSSGSWQINGLSAGKGEVKIIAPGYVSTKPSTGSYLGSINKGEASLNLNFGLTKSAAPAIASSTSSIWSGTKVGSSFFGDAQDELLG